MVNELDGFKVGDKVRIINRWQSWIGVEGTIVDILEFDDTGHKRSRPIVCNGISPITGKVVPYWVGSKNIELISTKGILTRGSK